MRDNMRYVNHLGEVIDFGCENILINENDFRDYEWSYDEINNRVSRTYRSIANKTLPVIVYGQNCRETANRIYEIIDKDVRSNIPGAMWINGYYLTGYFTASAKSEYTLTNTINMVLVFTSDQEYWRKDVRKNFFAHVDDHDVEGLDYPYDYPYDYRTRINAANTIDTETAFQSSFEITIYGPAANPRIVIADHTYMINGTLMAGERVVINSVKKTVIKYNSRGETENWFGKRYKLESVFEAIPPGISSLGWDGSFGFTVVILSQRSEPPWELIEAPENDQDDEEDGYITEDGSVYVLSNGDVYEVA